MLHYLHTRLRHRWLWAVLSAGLAVVAAAVITPAAMASTSRAAAPAAATPAPSAARPLTVIEYGRDLTYNSKTQLRELIGRSLGVAVIARMSTPLPLAAAWKPTPSILSLFS